MSTSKVQVTQGSGKNIATNSFTEDSVTKEAQRVVLNNSSGTEIGNSGSPLYVDPVGTTTQPISGTVIANLSDTDKAVLDSIAVAVSGSEMQVDIVADQALDNATDTITASLDTNALMDDTTALTPKFVAIAASSSGNNTLVAAVASKKIRVLSYSFVCASAVTARFEDGAGGTALSGQMEFAANGGISAAFNPLGHFETTANTLLNLELSSAVSVAGHLCYVEV